MVFKYHVYYLLSFAQVLLASSYSFTPCIFTFDLNLHQKIQN